MRSEGGERPLLSVGITQRELDGEAVRVKGGKVVEKEKELLSPTASLFHEPGFDCYIIAVFGFGKRIDVDVFKQGLETTLVLHPRFSSVLVPTKPKGEIRQWLRTKVDLNDHVIVPSLSGAGGVPPDLFISDYVADLSTTNLNPSRPLWELHVLNLSSADAEAVGVFRIHHSLGDGTSLISLLLACTRKSSDPESLHTLPEPRRRADRRSLLHRAWALLALAWNTMVDVFLLLATVVYLADTDTPLKAPKESAPRRRRPMRLLHRTFSLDDIKAVKDAMHCTVNDVLLGVTSAGLSRYLSQKNGSSPLESIRLRTPLVFNLRPQPGIPALAKMMEEGSGRWRWGNAVGYAMVRLPVAEYKDPLDYVRKGKEVAERKKNSFEAVFSYVNVSMSTRLFSSKVTSSLTKRLFDQTTLTFSNNVGPMEEIEFCGHPILYIAPGVYGLPHAITLHCQSYMNKIKFVVSVDEMAVPDPEKLLVDIAKSLELIKDAALSRS